MLTSVSNHTGTIAAIATPPGAGGIAIIRMSGAGTKAILATLFRPAQKKISGKPFHFLPRYMHYGFVHAHDGVVLDAVLAVYMPGPRTATGEDVGEIHCHGGAAIARAILEECLLAGAIPAEGGEFTRRAFLNGRIDLTQAEAVAEAIAAPTREGVRLAGAKLQGALGAQVAALRAGVDALAIRLTVAIDFPDEEGEILGPDDFTATVQKILYDIQNLIAGYERARLWREGARAALIGRVNAGKSSLLNAFLGLDRAIVSPVPGTTRDYLEETVNFGGIAVRLLDTAGLRSSTDSIEEEGIRRSLALAEQADIVLLVVDASQGPGEAEKDFLARKAANGAGQRIVLVLNKVDTLPQGHAASVPGPLPHSVLESCWPEFGPGFEPNIGIDNAQDKLCRVLAGTFAIAARTGAGLHELGQAVHDLLSGQSTPFEGGVAPNLRQAGLLGEAAAELEQLALEIPAGLPPDLASVRLDSVRVILDSVTGRSSTDDILGRIFADFCIGK